MSSFVGCRGQLAPEPIPLHWTLCNCRLARRCARLPVRPPASLFPFTSWADRAARIAAIWTLVFSIAFTVMFLHTSLWRHWIASAGSQAVWILFTWCVWVASTATMNRALPLISTKAKCAGVEYCGQLRAAFGMSGVSSHLS